MKAEKWNIYNPSGNRRVLVTKKLPGEKWIKILETARCRIEVCTSKDVLAPDEIKEAIDGKCDGVIGQLNENWNKEVLLSLKNAGGVVYTNYAVGFNNVDVKAATSLGLPVGNTPGILTRATAELAVALTFAAARRICESERFMRAGKFKGWLPDLFLGKLLTCKTLGIIGAGRIGSAYAKMMVEGCKMNLIYYSNNRNTELEKYIGSYGEFLKSSGYQPVTCTYARNPGEVFKKADCISLHTALNKSSHHLIDARALNLMKKNAVLINTSRGPVIDESALVAHCLDNPDFRAGLDVFEDEPKLTPGLTELENVVIIPHIGSATQWTRESMAVLAAYNLIGVFMKYPVWQKPDMEVFLGKKPPEATPSILNAEELGLKLY